MENKTNIWLVTGLPGSGKSTIANELIKSGDFQGLEASENFCEVFAQLGPHNIAFLMDQKNFPSKEAQIDAFAQYMITLHGATCDIWEQSEISGSQLYPPVVEISKRMAHLSHSEFTTFILKEFFPNTFLYQMFFNYFNAINVGHKAVNLANQQTKPVLLTGAHFKNPQNRNEIKVFLEGKGFDSRLLIVRSTRERLRQVAAQREADSMEASARTAIGIHLTDPPFSLNEGWNRVVVVNNTGSIEDAVRATRERIANPEKFTTTGDVSLVYEPRIRLQ